MTPRHLLILSVATLATATAVPGLAQEETSSNRRMSKRALRTASKEFDTALRSRDDAKVIRGVEEFTAKDDPRIVKLVIEKALLSDNLAAVRAASQSLRQVRNPKSQQAIADAFGDSRKTWQRLRLARLLDALPATTAQQSLRDALRDKFFGVREAALQAIATLRVADLQTAATRALRDDNLRVRRAAARAVAALGGEVPEGLAINEAGVLPSPLGSDGVIFVVAASNAMAKPAVIPPDLTRPGENPTPEGGEMKPPATATRLEIVGRLISQAVAAETRSLSWDALAFHLSVNSFAGKKGPARGGAKASAGLERWLRIARTDRARDILRALQAAMDKDWVDTIVLFTDGLPVEARIGNPQEIIDAVSLEATDRALVIHTVAISDGQSSEGLSREDALRRRRAGDELKGFVSALAAETGGNSRSLVLSAPGETATAARPKPGTPPGSGATRPGSGGHAPGGGAAAPGDSSGSTEPAQAGFSIKLRGTDRVVASELTRVKRALQAALKDGPAGPSDLEAVLTAMGSCPDPKVTLLTIDGALFHSDPEISELALTAISGNQHEKVQRLLAERAEAERDAARSCLLVSCLTARGPLVADRLVDLLGHTAPRTRSRAARLLAAFSQAGLATVAERLQRAFKREESRRVRHELARALERANGAAPEGYDLPTMAAGDWLSGTVPSGRVVFLVDINKSMATPMVDPRAVLVVDAPENGKQAQEPKPPSRLQLAARAVSEAVAGLAKDARFDVVAFGGLPRAFGRGGLGKVRSNTPGMVRDWLENQRLAPDRDPLRALTAVFDDGQVDTIYLISDGLPKRATTRDTDEILKAVWLLNRTRQVPIHVIVPVGSYDYHGLSEIDRARRLDQRSVLLAFLKQLASQNRGSFTLADGAPPAASGANR